MSYSLIVLISLVALLEGTHATLVQEIANVKPALGKELGRTGPGYYFFGLFWFAPTYRRSLFSGRLKAELAGHPRLLRLAAIEQALWYAMWCAVAALILL